MSDRGSATKRSLSLLVVALLMLVVAHAAPGSAVAENQEGVAAFQRGDYRQALADFWKSAAQGEAAAENNLGSLYAQGQGVLDNAKALKWFRLAAAQGYAPAEYNLGLMYAAGQGVPQDYGKALKWYRLAAAQGYARAVRSLKSIGETSRQSRLRGRASSAKLKRSRRSRSGPAEHGPRGLD